MTAGARPTASSLLGCGGLEGLPMTIAAPAAGTIATPFTGGSDLQMAVNELLVQMQSFDEPTGGEKLLGRLVDEVNLLLPAAPAAARPGRQARQHPAHRLDQPGRRARPGAAAARPVRPAAHLRAAGQGRPPRS